MDDLSRATLGLGGRFPRLRRLELQTAPAGGELSPNTFVDFAVAVDTSDTSVSAVRGADMQSP